MSFRVFSKAQGHSAEPFEFSPSGSSSEYKIWHSEGHGVVQSRSSRRRRLAQHEGHGRRARAVCCGQNFRRPFEMIRSASLRPKWPPGELHALQKRLFIFGRRKPRSRVAAFARTTAGVLFGAAFLVYASDSRAGVHEWLVVPALHAWTKDDPERGHELAIAALKSGLSPKDKTVDDPALALKVGYASFFAAFSRLSPRSGAVT
jgi:hypothetical protein